MQIQFNVCLTEICNLSGGVAVCVLGNRLYIPWYFVGHDENTRLL